MKTLHCACRRPEWTRTTNRTEGPTICLAQPNGLGTIRTRTVEGQGPDHLPPATATQNSWSERRGRGWVGGPSVYHNHAAENRKWPGRWPS